MEKYNMTFFEVLGEVFQTKGRYRGAKFPIGTYISVDGFGSVSMYQIQEDGSVEYAGSLNMIQWLLEQKYKRLQ